MSSTPPPGIGTTRTVLTVSGALAGSAFPVFLVGALAGPLSEDLGMGAAGIGLALAAFFAGAALAALPGGILADRIGSAWSLRLGLLVVAAAALGVAGLATGLWTLVGLMAISGTALGAIDPGGARAFAAGIPRVRQGLAFGVKEAAVPASALVAGLVLAWIVEPLGWQAAFMLAAGLAVAVALSVPADLGRPGSAMPARAATTGEGGAPTADAPTGGLVLLAGAAALGGGAATAAATFLVASATTAGFEPSHAGLLLSGASGATVAVRVLIGRWADRRAGGEIGLLTTLLALGAVGAGVLVTGWPPGIVIGALLLLAAGWGWTGLAFLAAVRLDQDRPARAAGLVLGGLAVGGGAGPAGFGALVSAADYAWAWTAVSVALALAAGCSLLASRRAGHTPLLAPPDAARGP